MRTLLSVFVILLCCAALHSETYTLRTGNQGGTYYPIGQAIASAVRQADSTLVLRVEAGFGSVDNCRRLQAGRASFIIAQDNIVTAALVGTSEFAGERQAKLRHVATLFPEAVQVIVRRDAGITEWKDMRGRRVCLGEHGSGTQHDAEILLAAHGISPGSLDTCTMSFPEVALGLSRGEVDAAFITSGVPTASLASLQSVVELSLLPLDPETAAAIMEQYPLYKAVNITPGDYAFLKDDVLCLGCTAQLLCSEDVPEDVVYRLCKALWEHTDVLAASHPMGAAIHVERALQYRSAPLHDGAVRYYTEAGLLQ